MWYTTRHGLWHIRYFAAIAREGNISPATEALVRLVRGRVKECADIEDFKKGDWS